MGTTEENRHSKIGGIEMILARVDGSKKRNIIEIEGDLKTLLNELGNLNANVVIQLMDGLDDEEDRVVFKNMMRGFMNYVLDDALENGRNSKHIEKGDDIGTGKTI